MVKQVSNTVDTLHSETLAYKLYVRVNDGERKTINEWAEFFDCFPSSIQTALGKLRKRGAHFHPVGTKTGDKGKSKQGDVVDIFSDQEYFEEIYNRRIKNTLIPGLKDFHDKSERALSLFPRLKDSISAAFNMAYSFLKSSRGIIGLSQPSNKIATTKEELEEIFKH